MTTLLVLLAAGTLVGILARDIEFAHRAIPILANGAVYALLFLLGVSVASNERVVGNLAGLGWPALCIATASVIGSCLAVRIIEKWLFRAE